MWASVVVVKPKVAQQTVERFGAKHRDLIKTGFERAEEALDSTVLPRAARLGELAANAEQFEGDFEHAAPKDGFIVHADCAGLAVFADGNQQMPEQREGAFVGEALQDEDGTTAVIEHTKDRVDTSATAATPYSAAILAPVALASEVNGPDLVSGELGGQSVFEFAACLDDLVMLASHAVRDKAFADAHSAVHMQAVEAVRQFSATRRRHQGFEADDLSHDPGGFGGVAGVIRWTDLINIDALPPPATPAISSANRPAPWCSKHPEHPEPIEHPPQAKDHRVRTSQKRTTVVAVCSQNATKLPSVATFFLARRC